MTVVVGSSTHLMSNVLRGVQRNPQVTSSVLCPDPAQAADLGRRKQSFLFWPSHSPVPKETLIEAGFYFTGKDDEVRCFHCGVTHDNWEKLDDPIGVHLRENPTCAFIREKVSTLTKNVSSSARRARTTRQRRRRGSNDDDVSPARRSPAGSDVKQDGDEHNIQCRSRRSLPRSDDPVVREMSELKNRLKSFEGKWKKSWPVTSEDLANAGLFYKGPEDRVQCAFCKGILKDWETGDSPLGEHTRHFPGCPHVARMNREPSRVHKLQSVRVLLRMEFKESDVIDAAMRLRKKGNADPTTDALIDAIFELQAEQSHKELTSAVSETQTGFKTDADPISEELTKLREENKALKDSARCKICLDSDVESLILPCRHLVCCSQCVERVDTCPVCRSEVLGTVRVFVS